MIRKLLIFGIAALCGACGSIEQKGTVTIHGRGTKLLTEKGDRLMDTGVYAKKDVPAEFAEGYAKGVSDQTKREYWAVQDGGQPRSPHESNAEGKVNYYNLTVPEQTDRDGVKRAPREVSVPIVEFWSGGKP